MPKYKVRVAYMGETTFEVNAMDEEDAQDKAMTYCERDHEGLGSMEPGDPKLVEEKPDAE